MESNGYWPAAAVTALLVVFGTLAFLAARWLLG